MATIAALALLAGPLIPLPASREEYREGLRMIDVPMHSGVWEARAQAVDREAGMKSLIQTLESACPWPKMISIWTVLLSKQCQQAGLHGVAGGDVT